MQTFLDILRLNFDKINIVNPLTVAYLKVVLLLMLTCFINWLLSFILKKLNLLVQKTTNRFDDSVISSLSKPIFFFIWATFLSVSINIINIDNRLNLSHFNKNFLIIYLSICVLWLCFRFVDNYKKNIIIERQNKGLKIDFFTLSFLAKISKAIIIVIGILSIMIFFKINIGGILAFGGISGIVIAFATKDILSNIFSAVAIYINKPFTIGDWISSPDREIEGVVQNIEWRQTTIMTFDKYPIHVPNTIFSEIIIQNQSHINYRRILESFYIRYEDINKVQKITQGIIVSLRQNKRINQEQTLRAYLDTLDCSAIKITIYTFTNTKSWEEYLSIKQEVLLSAYEVVKKNKAKLTSKIPNIIKTKE